MKVRPVRTRIFKEHEDLVAFILEHIPKLKNGSVLVVTSKIAALAEGRTSSMARKATLIQKESDWTLKTKYGLLTYKDGILMWNAGIDTSNAAGRIILLPADSFKIADLVRKALKKHYKVKRLGVLVSDSRIMPLRNGVVGLALGYAGFKGIRNYIGKKDIFGEKYRVTRTDIADGLATASVLVMGEGAERQPLCIIEDAPVEFTERVNKKELLVSFKSDMYGPLFKRIGGRKRGKS